MLWGDEHEITAVENRQDIANCYEKQFPGDKMIIADAYEYLENHFTEFDFIWASPPCQSHTMLAKIRTGRKYNGTYENDRIRIPDMKLYGIILFLQHLFRGKWVVENVKPFYEPLIPPTAIIGRHYIWSNVYISSKKNITKNHLNDWKKECEIKGLDYKLVNDHKFETRKDVIVHNCVSAQDGKYILDHLLKKETTILSYIEEGDREYL